ncbi:threonine dehydratase [Dendrobium catenatum]|uniref:Threonine dehydratase n=1 Tax=Dendrobium catenatum TaxID=906689 RepID=A0A2I0WXV2_9ASPA|nr:threonine dehydratase [Dendrobium catenatum]
MLWDQLMNFYSICNFPWLVGGDFNAITSPFKRIGGSSPSYRSMADFNNMILSYNLIDIGFVGNNFTLNRGHLWKRLDHVLFNDSWINSINFTNVQHLSRTLYDHSPLLITIKNRHFNESSHFIFENMRLLNDSFFDFIQYN